MCNEIVCLKFVTVTIQTSHHVHWRKSNNLSRYRVTFLSIKICRKKKRRKEKKKRNLPLLNGNIVTRLFFSTRCENVIEERCPRPTSTRHEKNTFLSDEENHFVTLNDPRNIRLAENFFFITVKDECNEIQWEIEFHFLARNRFCFFFFFFYQYFNDKTHLEKWIFVILRTLSLSGNVID